MIQRGKLVVLLVLLLALAATAFAWRYQVQRGDRALQFWGSEGAMLIRYAPRVELFRLEPADDAVDGAPETLTIGQRRYRVAGLREITGTSGLVHARQALIEDASFAGDGPPAREDGNWAFAFRFTKGSRQVTLALDTDCQQAWYCEKGRPVSVAPIARGLKTFTEEKLNPIEEEGE